MVRDIITEGTYLGNHTLEVQKGLTIGVILFIISEVFAFLSIFWAFFHSSLSPTIEIGGVWPGQLSLLMFLAGFFLITYFKFFFNNKTLYYNLAFKLFNLKLVFPAILHTAGSQI